VKFLTTTIHTGGHGALDRQRRMARALTAAGHTVLWMAPGGEAPGGSTLLTVPAAYGWLPGIIGWVLRLRRAFKLHRGALADVDTIFTVREYDTLGCLTDPNLKQVPHLFFMRGDTYACETFQATQALHWRTRLRSRITAFLYPAIQRFVLPRVSRIAVVAAFMENHLRSRIKIPMPSITTLANDADSQARRELPDPEIVRKIDRLKSDGRFLVGIVGQIFFRAKGFDIFLQAMHQLRDRPDIAAVVLGYGPEENAVPRMIQTLGLENTVTFVGRANGAHRLMEKFDLTVVPTQFQDACPNVVLEALAAGTCVLASDIDAHRAQLHHDTLLFPTGNVDALAKRIRELADDPAAHDQNRVLARERKDQFGFDWDREIVRLLEDVAGNPSNQPNEILNYAR